MEPFRARAAAHDSANSFPFENYEDLKASGLMGAFVPEALGGMGLRSVHDWAVGIERLAQGDASTAIAINMHYSVCRIIAEMWRRAQRDNDEQALARSEMLLRGVADGQIVICATATERGTDFLRPLTTASRTDTGWVLNGLKIFVTLSPIATIFVMNLRVEEAGGDKLAFAYVPAGTAGLEPQGDWDALGMRASGSQSVKLTDCALPEGAVQIAGDWGRWNPTLLMNRTLGNIALVGAFLGIAERARELAMSTAQSQTKPKFGGAIAGHSGVQQLLGRIDIALAGCRAILAETTRKLDAFLKAQDGEPPSLEAAHACMRDYQCAKWIVNQNAIQIVSAAMDVSGGGAYMQQNELSRLYRDVRGGPFMQPFSPTEAHEYVGQVGLGRFPEG